MAPAQLRKWLVLFCDEINLSDLDKYGENEGEGTGREKTRRRVSKTGEGEGREGRERKRKKWGKRKEEKINFKFFLLLGNHAENYIIFASDC